MITKKGRIIKNIDIGLLIKTLDLLQDYIEKHIEEIEYHGLNSLSFGLSSLFWTYYNDEKKKLEEFERQFNLSDAFKIEGVMGAEIKEGYLYITSSRSSHYDETFRISLRHKKDKILEIIKRKL